MLLPSDDFLAVREHYIQLRETSAALIVQAKETVAAAKEGIARSRVNLKTVHATMAACQKRPQRGTLR